MGKVQFIRDNTGENVYPVSHESAVYDTNGYTLEKKLSEIKPEDLYGSVNYTITEYITSELTEFPNWPGDTKYLNGGTHSRLLVNPGEVVKITTSNWCRVHFCNQYRRSIVGNTVPSLFTKYLEANKVYYFHVPEGATTMEFGRESTGGTDCTPAYISIASPRISTIEESLDVTVTPVYQFRINDANDKIAWVDSADAKAAMFRVKAGEKYYIFPSYNDGGGSVFKWGFIDDLPTRYTPVSDVSFRTASQFVQEGISIRVMPRDRDCYCFVSNQKVGDARLSIVVKRVPDETDPNRIDSVSDVRHSIDTVLTMSNGYEEINLNDYEKRPYTINIDNGLYGADSSLKHVVVPVTPGQIIKVVKNANYSARIAWLTTDEAPVASKIPAFVPGTRSFYVNNKAMTVPQGASYMFVYLGVGRHTPSFVGVYNGETGSSNDDPNDVLSLNPDSEFLPKLISAKKKYYADGAPAPLVLAHISDVHGNWDNVRRFIKFCDHHKGKIDELINTGDNLSGSLYTNGTRSAEPDEYAAIDGVSKILMVIGNHDTAGRTDGTWSWREYAGKTAYDEHFAPHISSWGVTQPSGAALNGYCYYYKDYSENNIRLVVTDVMGYDDTQDAWLSSVLGTALLLGRHVVIATHFSGARPAAEGNSPAFEKIRCNYTTLYPLGTTASGLHTFAPESYKMMATVDSFIQDGGIFVGYIQGHYHADFVSKVAKYPNQLIFSIGATKAGEMRDYAHTVGKRDQDEFQIISIDTYDKIVKLYKVGANVDRWGRHKNSVCISYDTQEIIAEGY